MSKGRWSFHLASFFAAGHRLREAEMKIRFSREQVISILKDVENGAKPAELRNKHGISSAALSLFALDGAWTMTCLPKSPLPNFDLYCC